jgi:hypothetical protein
MGVLLGGYRTVLSVLILNENRLVAAADWDVMDVDIALRLPRGPHPID